MTSSSKYCFLVLFMGLPGIISTADVYRWDTGEKISGTTPQQYANFSGQNLSFAALDNQDLRNTSFVNALLIQAHFTGSDMWGASMSGADLTGSDLRGALFRNSNFKAATLTDAQIQNTALISVTDSGFTKEQFYSTATYKSGHLKGIDLSFNGLNGWDFSGKNLEGVSFYGATLTDADFTNARIQGAGFGVAFVRINPSSPLLERCGTGLTKEQLYSTLSYQEGDLSHVRITNNVLPGAALAGKNLEGSYFNCTDLSGSDLTNANIAHGYFGRTSLKNANLTGADMRGSSFQEAEFTFADLTDAYIQDTNFTNVKGFSLNQLYSTANYKKGYLNGIKFDDNNFYQSNFAGLKLENVSFSSTDLRYSDFSGTDLSGNFLAKTKLNGVCLRGANLTNMYFQFCDLTGADLSNADLRGSTLAYYPSENPLYQAYNKKNLVRLNGHVEGGLNLSTGETMRIWDYTGDSDIPIVVEDGMTIAQDAVLRLVFEDGQWGSTISFEEGADVNLGGTLELLIDQGINPESLMGMTFQIFDWTGANRIGEFEEIVCNTNYGWNTSDLYTLGTVTLVPEPATAFLLTLGGLTTMLRRKVKGGVL